MQTKQQISLLLAGEGVAPNKHLGQHFLIDLNLMRLLLDTASISSDDVVLEVGCGTGSLTEGLVERAGAVVGVEFDPVLARIVSKQLQDASNLTLINADALAGKNTVNPEAVGALTAARARHAGRLLLVANLPYQIASPLMLNLVTGPIIADAMYVTVQKEVADRMIAEPGGSDYGILSVILAATGLAHIVRKLKPAVFWPRPAVDSAIVAFERRSALVSRIADMAILMEVVGLFMGHRRKMLKAAAKLAAERLSGVADWPAVFESCSIDPHVRPEQISPKEYVSLSNACSGVLKRS